MTISVFIQNNDTDKTRAVKVIQFDPEVGPDPEIDYQSTLLAEASRVFYVHDSGSLIVQEVDADGQ